MCKCDFCKYSKPNGKCRWGSQAMREAYCEEAIERMIKALKGR